MLMVMVGQTLMNSMFAGMMPTLMSMHHSTLTLPRSTVRWREKKFSRFFNFQFSDNMDLAIKLNNMSICPKLITQLENINIWRLDLSQKIEAFQIAEETLTRDQKIDKLLDIYATRKMIKNAITETNGIFTIEFDEYLEANPEIKVEQLQVKLGGYSDGHELLRALVSQGGIHVDEFPRRIFSDMNFPIVEKETQLNLVCIAVKDLSKDFKNSEEEIELAEILKVANKIGLNYCPEEACPQLFRQHLSKYSKELPDSFFIICAEGGWDPPSHLVFRIKPQYGVPVKRPHLDANWYQYDVTFKGDTQLIFCRY
jgi:hypothetical protein